MKFKDYSLLEYVVVCGKCGTESDSLWCIMCWEIMEHWTKQKPIDAWRCEHCQYPESHWEVVGKVKKFCNGCGIYYGVKLIPVPKKKKKPRMRRTADTAGTYTTTIPINQTTATTGNVATVIWYSGGGTATATASA